jgi:hypothetical protein
MRAVGASLFLGVRKQRKHTDTFAARLGRASRSGGFQHALHHRRGLCPVRAMTKMAADIDAADGLGFTLRPEAIASLLLEAGSPPTPRSDPPGIAISDLTDDLVEPLIRLLRLVERHRAP